jgi:hypothetical protein
VAVEDSGTRGDDEAGHARTLIFKP